MARFSLVGVGSGFAGSVEATNETAAIRKASPALGNTIRVEETGNVYRRTHYMSRTRSGRHFGIRVTKMRSSNPKKAETQLRVSIPKGQSITGTVKRLQRILGSRLKKVQLIGKVKRSRKR